MAAEVAIVESSGMLAAQTHLVEEAGHGDGTTDLPRREC
jgi:hypothetical protein